MNKNEDLEYFWSFLVWLKHRNFGGFLGLFTNLMYFDCYFRHCKKKC